MFRKYYFSDIDRFEINEPAMKAEETISLNTHIPVDLAAIFIHLIDGSTVHVPAKWGFARFFLKNFAAFVEENSNEFARQGLVPKFAKQKFVSGVAWARNGDSLR